MEVLNVGKLSNKIDKNSLFNWIKKPPCRPYIITSNNIIVTYYYEHATYYY